jgi:serine protease Do
MIRAFALSLALATAVGNAQSAIDRAQLVGMSASVLKIETLRTQGGYAMGSGVVVDEQLVVTNCHVTRDAAQIHVLRGGARWRVVAQAVDVDRDLCVLRVPDIQATAVQLGSAADLQIGQPVMALGYTGGLGIQNSSGDVVALHRHDSGSVIQTSNWFNSGASGGGLFDHNMRLVGILTYRLRGGDDHYFAAPVDWLQTLLRDPTRFRPVQPIASDRMAYWQRPIAEQPNFLRAALLESKQDWPALAQLARQWAESDGTDAEPWYLHGLALAELNRPSDAQTALEQSLAIEPRSGRAWWRLGLVCIQRGLVPQASKAQSRLVTLRSEYAQRLARALQRI